MLMNFKELDEDFEKFKKETDAHSLSDTINILKKHKTEVSAMDLTIAVQKAMNDPVLISCMASALGEDMHIPSFIISVNLKANINSISAMMCSVINNTIFGDELKKDLRSL